MVESSPAGRTRARLRRFMMCTAVAGLALAAAPALAHARATITVGVHTQPAGAAATFTFHVTGPTCPNRPATDVTLHLRDGETAAVPLCRGQLFTVTQDPLPGWTLTAINCVATPPDPEDPFVIDVPHARAGVELSPDEQKACTFTNTAPPTPPSTPTTPSTPSTPTTPSSPTTPTSGSAPVSTPAQGVSPERVVAARASLQATKSCAERRFTVTVRGGNVRSVAFSVNGRHVRTIRAKRNQRRFTAVLPARTAVNRVVARVTFTAAASPRTRTLRATVRRCTPAAVRPNFTG
jgi:ribosomal protein L35